MEGNSCVYYVKPLKMPNFRVQIRVPGSKSITNRAICLAAFAEGRSIIRNISLCNDSLQCVNSIEKLGVHLALNKDKETIEIEGCGGTIIGRNLRINVDSAGTTARFLTAILSTSTGHYFIDASQQMRRRPMKHLLDALRKMGAVFDYTGQEDHFPFYLNAKGLEGGQISVECKASSQFLSALLMCGPFCKNNLEITVSDKLVAKPYIDITMKVMKDFGVEVKNDNYKRYVIKNDKRYRGNEYEVEPDFSSACYFLSIPALVGGEILVEGISLSTIQGDVKYLDVLEKLGCEITELSDGILAKGPKESKFPGIEVDMNEFSDQSITLAAMGVYAESPMIIRNIAHVKYQESNRIEACITELRRLGIRCEELDDGFVVYPEKPREATIRTYNDHRMAMAFSLIGLRTPGIRIVNPGCTAKTFPNYFSVLDSLYKKPPKSSSDLFK